MYLSTSSMISEIDAFAEQGLGISVATLMARSGDAVANAIRTRAPKGSRVRFLCGKGNNGGDGYAAALKLMDEYDVAVYDVFGSGQRSAAGRLYLEKYIERGGKVINFRADASALDSIKNSDCIVDAIFGTGFHGEIPEDIRPLAEAVNNAEKSLKIAIDVPLGVNADDGSVFDIAISVTATVELSYIKAGLVSYPARSYVGEIICDSLDLPREKIEESFKFRHTLIDREYIREILPNREKNSNKGSFGKALLITGSDKYRGAAHLTVESALRGGVGLVSFLGEKELVSELRQKYPEVIYNTAPPLDNMTDTDIAEALNIARGYGAVLIGSGSGNTEGIRRLTLAFLGNEGAPLVLDADSLNSLASMGKEGIEAIKNSKRKVIITPHPLEFARLIGSDVDAVQSNRLSLAESFAVDTGATLVLKGAGTVITDGDTVCISPYANSALAKAGSGDVLAGFLTSLVAQNSLAPVEASSLAVYYHALAGETLAEEYSAYGVTPSDLPKEIARHIAKDGR